MRIKVIPVIRAAADERFSGKTAVVIDTLRATSNMVAGLAAGVASILPCETIREATDARKPGDLLGGERKCRKIPGFDLGNSPYEYMSSAVRGKRIVMTTTNGTRALGTVRQAAAVIACSLLNARACAAAAAEWGRDVTVLCAGTEDRFNLEDGVTAGLFIHELLQSENVEKRRTGRQTEIKIDDFGKAMLGFYRSAQDHLTKTLLDSDTGKRLSRLGLQGDVLFCSRSNRFDLVPILSGDALIPLTATVR
jgi:2-phosphosulfolactate phosphatase